MRTNGPHQISDLLLADLKHFGESLWRNDDIGERRFNFFLTLMTSVIAVLVALYTAKEGTLDKDNITYVTRGALAGLFLLGIMTYLRLLQKNRVTHEYHETLSYIRNKLANIDPTARPYEVPQRIRGKMKWLRAGLAETVGVLTAGLLFALLAREHVPVLLAGTVSAVLAIGLVFAAAYRKDAQTPPGSDTLLRDAGGVSTGPAQYFRAGVGVVIINNDGHVLALERADAPGAWQMPQGGLEIYEEPRQAMYREVFEETCISGSGLKFLECYPDLVAYELPLHMRSAKTGRGQVQYWSLFKLETDDDQIDLKTGAEFANWRWMPPERVLELAVEFRKPTYRQLFDHFRPYLSTSRVNSNSDPSREI